MDSDHQQDGQSAEKKEKFDDVICDELKLKEWAFFEHYEDISEGVKSSQYLANLQKVAWFNDIISFWQVWNNLPINDLKNYFYDISTNTFQSQEVLGKLMRINCLSLFLNSLSPSWEDKTNAKGGEFVLWLTLADSPNESSLDKMNTLWEQIVVDAITNRFPASEQVVGVRIVDKSSSGREGFRLEVWVRTDKEENEDLKKIKEFIEKEYGTKNRGPYQQMQFKTHR